MSSLRGQVLDFYDTSLCRQSASMLTARCELHFMTQQCETFLALPKLISERGCCDCSCEDESIDELAAFLGHGEAVAALTTQ